MSKIAKKLTDLIGNTPLLELGNFAKTKNAEAKIIGKLEYFNPLGSVKDRIAFSMIEDAERKGTLKEGSVIIDLQVETRVSDWRMWLRQKVIA